MAGLRSFRWSRRSAQTSTDRAQETAAPLPEPLPRPPMVEHHWLTLAVVRSGPAGAIPVPAARVVVRPFLRGSPRPEEPVARGSTAADGTFAVSLPAGRYAVYAQHEGEGKAVTVTLEHAGRATLVLESLSRRATLTVEASGMDGHPLAHAVVEVRALPSNMLAARAGTDAHGAARLVLPPGAYEVRVGDAVARTYVEADTLLRLAATEAPREAGPAPAVSKYAQKARAATAHVAPLDPTGVRDESWN